MTLRYVSATWAHLGTGMGNHLWQSTLCAAAAGLLALMLRKNQARARYWLWLAASVKFLIPFSPLVALGSRLAWLRGTGGIEAGLYVVVEQVSQPFTQPVMSDVSRAASPLVSPALTHLLPSLLAGVWFCGCAGVMVAWCVRWRRVALAIRDAVSLREGREVEALRRVERSAGIAHGIDILLSTTTLEPGIFGMARPVLLWPEGISEHLDDGHLEAVLAHELWHVRRRDNLAAAIHMVVEAAFWFHPLVWWLGARLVDERERACDEQVLESGSERQVYAESILKVCEFSVGSPLACVSGVTGADLKKRMVHIMSEHVVRKLDFGRKLLLSAVALMAIAAPIVFGLFNATPGRAQSQSVEGAAAAPAFQSVSIKPSEFSTLASAGGKARAVRVMQSPEGFVASNVTLRALVQEAYGVQASQISGPERLDSAAYDIEAKTGRAPLSEPGFEAHEVENRLMLQTLLADQFKLTLHRENKALPGYALIVGENGAKVQPAREAEASIEMIKGPEGHLGGHRIVMQLGNGQQRSFTAQGVSVQDFATQLSRQLGAVVVDKTGLVGNYDFNLHWAAGPTDESKDVDAQGSTGATGASGPSLFTAVQERLGLKLEPQKQPMEILVIDHVERPADI